MPRITGQDLLEVAKAKKSTAGGLDSGPGMATWLLDAYIAMIPKVVGDSAPLGQRPLCVLPVFYRLWASLRLTHLRKGLRTGFHSLSLVLGMVSLR